MYKKYKIGIAALGIVMAVALILAAWPYLRGTTIAVLEPMGHIARREQQLIVFGSILSLFVVVPVFGLLFYILWKYRASNTKASYAPDWDRNNWYEAAWWLIPTILILVLSVVTWNSTHELDPYKKLQSSAKPLTIQVVALNWKWLFIYPESNIATVNYVQFPKERPVEFVITSDTTMNSFWIPQLGGQVYAMSGMSTKLHLIADGAATYRGLSANISGEGFARMTFEARSTSQADFDTWVTSVKQSRGQRLNETTYAKLAEPTQGYAITKYPTVDRSLYDTIVMKYMKPAGPTSTPRQQEMNHEHQHHTMPGMDHGDM